MQIFQSGPLLPWLCKLDMHCFVSFGCNPISGYYVDKLGAVLGVEHTISCRAGLSLWLQILQLENPPVNQSPYLPGRLPLILWSSMFDMARPAVPICGREQ
jgi:hypothetical protein